ncbi:MAG: RNA polymerase sigma factor [bacterium]|nr:RNA polymerase sigma factor [bacterium]
MTMKNEEIIFAVKQCLNGRTETFSQIIRYFQKRIHHLCLYYLKTPQDAEDAAADIFIKAYNALNTFNPQYKFSTWLFKIAVNRSLEILRKQKRERDYLLTLPTLPRSSDNSQSTQTTGPADTFFKESQKKSLKNTLKTLPEKYQTALMLKYHDGFAYQEIADIMDIPANTVGSLILRGKKELRGKLKEKGAIR